MDEAAPETSAERIRRARGKFAAMAGTYCLGVFNDNFYRQSAMLLAAGTALTRMQGHTTILFALPYVLFAAPVGWLADRFSKGKVVIAAKALEVAAMICGAIGILTGRWPLILLMAFAMGLQSAVFGPALNGSIPELYPPEYVTRANALLKVVVTATILVGVASAGFALDCDAPGPWGVPVGRLIVAAVVVGISALGVAASVFVPRRPAAAPKVRFPWTGPVHTLAELVGFRRDRLLAVVVIANTFVWSLGLVLMMVINELGKSQLGRGEAVTGAMVTAELAGLAVGGLIGSRIATGPRWHRVLAPAAAAIGVLAVLTAGVPLLPEPLRLGAVFVLLAGIGLAGGMFMIPCEAFIQVRPAPDRKGAVIATANFAVFSGIILSGLLGNELNVRLLPTNSFAVMGAAALLMSLWLRRALARRNGE